MYLFICITLVLIAFSRLQAGEIRVPENYATIQKAIDAAEPGDLVLVWPGHYKEQLFFKGKAITVASRYLITGNREDILNTVVEGIKPIDDFQASVVYFTAGEDSNSVLIGFTLRDGHGTVVERSGVRAGGAVLVIDAGPKLLHNNITYNYISSPGHDACGGGIYAESPREKPLVMQGNTIHKNRVHGGISSAGGGICLRGSGLLRKNVISYNTLRSSWKSASGGGVAAVPAPRTKDMLYFTGNTVKYNRSLGEGAATSGFGGGAYFSHYVEAWISTNDINNNEVRGNSVSFGAGVSLYSIPSPARFIRNRVHDNYYSGLGTNYGGGISLENCAPRFANNLIYGNASMAGGGVYYANATVSGCFANNTICDNNAMAGGGICITAAAPIIFNSIIWENEAMYGASIYGDEFEVTVQYSTVMGGWPGRGNLTTSPCFSDDEFRPGCDSPCLGSGMDTLWFSGDAFCAPPMDLAGNPRPNPPGTRPDRGVWEIAGFQPEKTESYSGLRNYPNPFNPSTRIEFCLSSGEFVRLWVCDIIGRTVTRLVDGPLPAGRYRFTWDGQNCASGMYFYHLEAGDEKISRRMILLH